MGIININIDLQDTVDEFTLNSQQMEIVSQNVKNDLIAEIFRQWIEAASNQLNSSRAGYVRGLQVFDDNSTSGGIRLVGVLNNMLESGATSFDQKLGFSQSSKAKRTKDGGWYLTIPFRWATSDAQADSSAFSGILPPKIYNIIRTRAINRSGKAVLKEKDLPTEFKEKATRAATENYEAYTHKSAFFEGLVKQVNVAPSGGQQTQYNTFRRVSSNSALNSWIHPGLKAYNLGDEALRNVDTDTIVNNAVDKTLSEFGF